ncbi:prepilin-type N-terminal cleavage/methylation domain-containing protein [Candidatus Peregrinibacteria bacterium]|jgi:prepilin-type N-terminal cleavage/methylation domain-containing protein|nr:prepilin-type N-terminal cleavage/methylation domain-containing protein [Candidatus Peregrinibacteria bacterium]MBT4148418.1 prepilin-type N-terminal cleavage/methylation domain-containing protein [Candidatus Peregrinibacteria bacterium]MBT4366477.1 prepilin-type N-terminal cleavage/methylation domain-containing protein [Candidatus Peregrinibacteria bacterium]MBT4456072.1 prepilin-type N-terminal cleavage/methylation domain-containing protein [Candidatus Peregrinibacteria bacterium]
MSTKILNNKKGFTLTEVLVGVLVLATAIVSASNLLVSMVKSNAANMSSLQAYYYTVEAVEAFRNMRDTHFMHNISFCGQEGVNLFGKDGSFVDGCNDTGYGDYYYAVSVNPGPSAFAAVSGSDLSASSPWVITPVFDVRGADARVSFNKDISTAVSTDFYRYCEVKPYEDSGFEGKAVEVTCYTEWEENGRDRKVMLSTVLTDWYAK